MNDDLATSDAEQTLRKQLTTVLSDLKDTLKADVVCVFVYDANTDSFHLPIGLGLLDPDSFYDPGMRPRGDRGAAKQVLQKSSITFERLEDHPDLYAAFAHLERIRSMAGVACTFQETIVGILYVNYRQHHAFNTSELDALNGYAVQLAELIAASSILRNLPKVSVDTSSPEDKTLQGIVELACSYTQSPVGIWLLDPKDESRLRIRAATGLPVRYRDAAVCHVGDPSLISQVFISGEWKVVEDLQQDEHFPYKHVAAEAGWVSAFGYPISSRGRRVGVLESFTFSPWHHSLITAHLQLADLVGVTLENSRRSEEAERLAELARQMSAATDFDSALHSIVKVARELTGAYSSSIFLYDKRSRRFNKEVRSPKLKIPADLPREKGLSSHIMKTGNVVHIRDSGNDELANKIRQTERAKSLIGVRLDINKEGVGVLYVRGNKPHQFITADEVLLTNIAAQASLALGMGRFLLKPISEIEAAAAKRYEQEAILEQICVETQKLGFEYAAIQLIRPEERIIETVYTNAESDWAGVAKHSLEADPKISDIQAEIALSDPPCIKIITGWYEKLDPWIYEEFKHQHYARVWVPIVLVRDERGGILESWFDKWVSTAENSKDNEVNDDTKKNRPGRCISMEMPLPKNLPDGYKSETIGTLEAGYYDPKATVEQLHGRISTEQAVSLGKLAARLALELRKTLLPYVLETIADRAWEIIRADSASLYFLYSHKRKEYIYKLCMGEFSRQFLKGHKPRDNGLGQSAICKGDVQFVPDASQRHHEDHLKDSNPTVWEVVGVRAMAAFPLLIDEKGDEQKGVLYVLFSKPHWFTSDEIGWIKLFASRAVEAIRNSINYTQARDNAKVLSALHWVSQSLAAKPQDGNLLRQIAGTSMNVLAADIVSIYEYVETLNRFLLPHDRAGSLLVDIEVSGLEPNAGPNLMLKSKEDFHFTINSPNDSIMNSPDLERSEMGSFIEREKIKSSAGIILRVGTEIVGVLFVHFRRPHVFTDQEKQIIKTLAANAALAIKNRRRFDTLKAGSRAILTTLDLDKLLGLIVKQAATITGGDVANIRLVEGTASDELVAHAQFPEYEPVDESLKCLKLGEGLASMVFLKKEARIIYDTNDETSYKPYFHGLRSVLYVPMLTGDGKLLGILVSGSRTVSKFDERDGMMLEALADQAVIALQNAQNQKQLAASEAMATLGDVAGNLLHRINNVVGAIRLNAQSLEQQLDGENKTTARDIIELSEQITDEASILYKRIPDRVEGIDIVKALNYAMRKSRIDKSIEIFCEIPESLPSVKGGEKQIQDIFVNLLQNARDAMAYGGKLIVSAEIIERDGKTWVKVCVSDNGTGILVEQLENVFSRHYSTKGSGHGFGLWWNKYYIERLGGKIEVKSEFGKGTCFTVLLPERESRVVIDEQSGELK
ncbi:MAG: GAF domain-containing protein [Candidatus Methylumidiphilus sp.]